MKKGALHIDWVWKTAAAVAVSVGLCGPAAAQVRLPQVMTAPVVRPSVPPAILLIKPSQALNIALQMNPAAKALGVQLRGPLYIVKLKQGNKIMQVKVDAASGNLQ